MRINIEAVMFVMVDIQERFKPHIPDISAIIRNASILNKGAELLKIPLLVTEQYPLGLGLTLEEIYIPPKTHSREKTRFSIFEPDIEKEISESGRKMIVLYGIEAHVCIMQSVLEALEKGYIPIVVEDAISSISRHNKEIAVRRIIDCGGIIVSTEMLLFELVECASHPDFREISKLVKLGVQ